MKKNRKALKYPLHYELCRKLYRQGVSEKEIANRLRIGVLDVRAWTRLMRSRYTRLFKRRPVTWSNGGEKCSG